MNGYDVLVAVGPDGVHEGALDLAVAEAERRGTGVLLMHVVHGLGDTQDLDQALTAVGHSVLTDAAGQLEGRIPFTTEIATGPAAVTLAERAASDGLVVLERRDAGTMERLLTMSVSTRVAAHAKAPVVVVPSGWRPAVEPLPIIVGVDDPHLDDGQLRTAVALARSTKRRLVVMYAVWLPEAYQGIAVGDERTRWVEQGTAAAQATLERIGAADVEVDVDVRWQRPVDGLVAATRRASMLVLGRRSGRFGVHLGALTRTVLRHAEGPVMVVDRA